MGVRLGPFGLRPPKYLLAPSNIILAPSNTTTSCPVRFPPPPSPLLSRCVLSSAPACCKIWPSQWSFSWPVCMVKVVVCSFLYSFLAFSLGSFLISFFSNLITRLICLLCFCCRSASPFHPISSRPANLVDVRFLLRTVRFLFLHFACLMKCLPADFLWILCFFGCFICRYSSTFGPISSRPGNLVDVRSFLLFCFTSLLLQLTCSDNHMLGFVCCRGYGLCFVNAFCPLVALIIFLLKPRTG